MSVIADVDYEYGAFEREHIKIMKKINCATKLWNFSQKTAESCVNLIFLTTFAKKLKDRELWQK